MGPYGPSDFFAEAYPLSQKISVWLKNRTASLVSSLGCPPQPKRSPCRLERAPPSRTTPLERPEGTAVARRAPQTLITKIARCGGASGARDRQSRRARTRWVFE